MKAHLAIGLFALLFGSKAPAATLEVLPLSAAQSQEILEQANAGAALLRKYIGSGPGYAPEQIDSAIVAWSTASSGKEPTDLVIERLGAYFGDYLAQKLDLEWKVYRDNRGSDLCVIHKKVWVFSFPHSTIYKAVVQGRQGALAEVEATLAKQINEGLRDPSIQSR